MLTLQNPALRDWPIIRALTNRGGIGYVPPCAPLIPLMPNFPDNGPTPGGVGWSLPRSNNINKLMAARRSGGVASTPLADLPFAYLNLAQGINPELSLILPYQIAQL